MNARTLLAEVRRRGITRQVTPDGRLRLTGPAEATLTPELQREAAAQRAELLTLLRSEAGGEGGSECRLPASEVAASRPGDADPQSADTPEARPGGGEWTVPERLVWGVAVAGVAAVAISYYFVGRPQAPIEPAPPPSPAFPLGVPYNGWEGRGQ